MHDFADANMSQTRLHPTCQRSALIHQIAGEKGLLIILGRRRVAPESGMLKGGACFLVHHKLHLIGVSAALFEGIHKRLLAIEVDPFVQPAVKGLKGDGSPVVEVPNRITGSDYTWL